MPPVDRMNFCGFNLYFGLVYVSGGIRELSHFYDVLEVMRRLRPYFARQMSSCDTDKLTQ